MSINIKREDVGVYVSLTMFGAGAGMLIGSAISAYVANRKFNKRLLDNQEVITEVDNDQEDQAQRYRAENEDETSPEDDVPWPSVSERTDSGADETSLESETGPEGVEDGLGASEELEGAGERTRERYDEVQERFEALTRKYHVTPIQIEMVRSRLLTLEDLEGELIRTNQQRDVYDRPSVDEVLDEEDGDIPFDILSRNPVEDPDHPALRLIELTYSPSEDRLIRTVAGGREIVVDHVHPYAIDLAQQLIERDDYEVVYIWERELQKAYSFRLT